MVYQGWPPPARQGKSLRHVARPSVASPATAAVRTSVTVTLRFPDGYSTAAQVREGASAARGIKAAIPEPADQIAYRKRNGAAGGCSVSLDVQDYQQCAHVAIT